jgi:hypothetical protein
MPRSIAHRLRGTLALETIFISRIENSRASPLMSLFVLSLQNDARLRFSLRFLTTFSTRIFALVQTKNASPRMKPT